MRNLFLITLLFASLNAHSNILKVENSCLKTNSYIEFNLNFPVQYSDELINQIYSVHCDSTKSKCNGVLIKNKDDVISKNDVVSMEDLKITSSDKGLVELKWGSSRLFKVEKNKVTMSENVNGKFASSTVSCNSK